MSLDNYIDNDVEKLPLNDDHYWHSVHPDQLYPVHRISEQAKNIQGLPVMREEIRHAL